MPLVVAATQLQIHLHPTFSLVSPLACAIWGRARWIPVRTSHYQADVASHCCSMCTQKMTAVVDVLIGCVPGEAEKRSIGVLWCGTMGWDIVDLRA